MSIIHVNAQNFNETVQTGKTALLDFFAVWCGPCRMISPIIEEIAEENPQLVVGKIDVDQEPDLASRFGVTSIPTLVVMREGRVVKTAVGMRSKAAILAMLQD